MWCKGNKTLQAVLLRWAEQRHVVCFLPRWPHLLPILQPEYVAKKIVNAVLTDQTYLFMPRSVYFLMFLKR